MEPNNIREVLKELIDYNNAEFISVRDNDGEPRPAKLSDLQEMNLEMVYYMCETLGMEDLVKYGLKNN